MGWVPIALSIAGTLFQMSAQQKQASAAKDQANREAQAQEYQAKQLEQNAGQEQAASQRTALEERRRANLTASRAAAVASASGGGLSDPSVQNLLGDIQGEGAYRAGVALYNGEDNARRMRMGAQGKMYDAQTTREAGANKADALNTQSFGTLLSGAGSIYRYWDQAKNSGMASGNSLNS